MLKAEKPSIANYEVISARPVKDGVLSTLCFQNSLYLHELMTISLSAYIEYDGIWTIAPGESSISSTPKIQKNTNKPRKLQ